MQRIQGHKLIHETELYFFTIPAKKWKLIFITWCRAAQLASIRQMTRQVSRGSAGEYQADERAGVAGLSWRESVR